MDLIIDNLIADDWEQVRAIYLEGIATGQATFENATPNWDQFDASHLPECRLVARAQSQIIGWAVLSLVSRRQAYQGVAEVSVYVAESHRGRGVGKLLLESIIVMSERYGIWTLQGATFPENAASLRLQESCGFRVVGRRERIARQQGIWRDTIITERRSRIVGTD